jgi:hypothetical protein
MMMRSALQDLKFVLTTISDIKAMSLDVETKIRDIQERYRTLAMYDIEVSGKRIIILCKFSYNTDQFKDINIRTLSVMDKLDSKTIITEMISGL